MCVILYFAIPLHIGPKIGLSVYITFTQLSCWALFLNSLSCAIPDHESTHWRSLEFVGGTKGALMPKRSFIYLHHE